MTNRCEYRFKIDAFTLDTLPMARLAEYMSDLAIILGEQGSVHFVRLDEGSAVLVHAIENEAEERVRERLKADNSVGILGEEGGTEIIKFLGRELEEPVTYGPFNQKGALDGKVIMVGGKPDPAPVHIEQGNTIYICQARRDVASALGRYLFQSELRVWGNGRWTREADGTWRLNRFTIESFEVLNDEPLSAVAAGLREAPGSGWRKLSDPWSELAGMRQHDDETH